VTVRAARGTPRRSAAHGTPNRPARRPRAATRRPRRRQCRVDKKGTTWSSGGQRPDEGGAHVAGQAAHRRGEHRVDRTRSQPDQRYRRLDKRDATAALPLPQRRKVRHSEARRGRCRYRAARRLDGVTPARSKARGEGRGSASDELEKNPAPTDGRRTPVRCVHATIGLPPPSMCQPTPGRRVHHPHHNTIGRPAPPHPARTRPALTATR